MRKPVEENGEWVLSFRDEQHKLNNENDAEEIAEAIENADRVEVLELRGNTVGVGAGQRLAVALERHPELKRALWSDMFTGRLKEEIPPILRCLSDAMMRSGTRLVELDLSDNAFGPIGAEGVEKFLESSSAYSLKILKLNNNGLGAGGKIVANALIRCHENAQRDGQKFLLRTFVAGRNRLEDPGAFALAKAFQILGSLEEIVMYQDGIRPKGIEALAKALRYNPGLKVINLSDNTFTVSGAQAMAQVIRQLTNLEVLNFGDCLCRDKGASAIVASLSQYHHISLKEINLSGNELSLHATEKIIDRLTQDFHLKSLVLHTNNIGGHFNAIKSKWERYSFIDLGEESDDQGSLDDEDEEDDGAELYSDISNSGDAGNEGDDERTEHVGDTDLNVTLDQSFRAGDHDETFVSFKNQEWNNEGDVQVLTEVLLSNKQVKVLHLFGNYIGVDACKKIGEVLRTRVEQIRMKSLEEINISQCGITAEGARYLSEAFRSHLNLKVIVLSKNTLDISGAAALANVLPSLRQLELLDLSSCNCGERGILGVASSFSSFTHLRLKALDFSCNGLGADVIQKIVRIFASGGFHLERLSLHSNCIGHHFDELKEAFRHIHFLDLGSDSSDRGSLEESASVGKMERESGNESDDERTEDPDQDIQDHSSRRGPAQLTMDDVVLFIRKPTLAVLDALTTQVKTLIDILQTDLHGRTQEITAALLCSFCVLLSAQFLDNQVVEQKIAVLADAILIAAEKVKRRPVGATESLCNQLLAYAGAVRSESFSQTIVDIKSVIFLLDSMLRRGHFRELLPTIKFSFEAIKKAHPNRVSEIDRFLQTLNC